MVSVRWWAGLVLVVGLALGAAAPAAPAATYCAGAVPFYECAGGPRGMQEALDAAGSNPGPDRVLIAEGEHRLATDLVYSDHGRSENGVVIASGAVCDRSGCGSTSLSGGAPGGTLLSFTGGGGADVEVWSLTLRPAAGVTGLMLPPGGKASVSVTGEDGSIGVRAEGTPARPAIVQGGFIHPLGGLQDIAVDAVGAAFLDGPSITSDIAARSRGSDGLLDIRNSWIVASTGVTGRHARLTRTLLDLRQRPGAVLGLDAVCPDAGARDAEISARNVTLLGNGDPAGIGARAIARGGDGESCDAVVRLNSTIVHGVGTSLDAVGESGSGGDPREGVARFELAYSNFEPSTIRQSGPSQVETGSPGGNVLGDPQFNPRVDHHVLNWDSPLIDRGDPAELDDWEQFGFKAINGRRDIGLREYQFSTPTVNPLAEPYHHPIRRGGTALLRAGAIDSDADPLKVQWTFSDGEQLEYEADGQGSLRGVERRYPRLGSYVEEVTATDPTGRSATGRLVIDVVRQRMQHLSIAHRRLRPPSAPAYFRDTLIRFRTRVPDRVYFRIERGVRRRASRRLRWVRTRHRFRSESRLGMTTENFNGWIDGRRLRPGRYRLVGAPRGVRPLRARFRVLAVRR